MNGSIAFCQPCNERSRLSALVKVHTKWKAVPLAVGASPVLHVRGARNVSQVRNAVVSWVAIDVINIAKRPLAVHIKPSQPMGPTLLVVKNQTNIAARIEAARNLIRKSRIPLRVAPRAPCEDPGFGIVDKAFAQSRGGNIGLSHDALQMLIGQRPASVASTVRASLFSWLARCTARVKLYASARLVLGLG